MSQPPASCKALGHGNNVEQGVANSYVAAVCHHGQQERLCGHRHEEKEMLGEAGRVGNGFIIQQETLSSLGEKTVE